MRIDLFLKKAGLIKRRIWAKNAINRKIVLLNNKAIKPGKIVEINDKITLNLGTQKEYTIEIVSVSPKNNSVLFKNIK
jgi:ribosomal 50S subunit-recycling heat shock protein